MATKPTPEMKFFAVLNKHLQDNAKDTIDPADYTKPDPKPYTGTIYQRNTYLVLDPPLESTIVGRITVVYDRIDFATFTNIRVEKGSSTSLMQLMPQINEALGIQMSMTDVVDTPVPVSGTMQVQASAGNLLYRGTLNVELV